MTSDSEHDPGPVPDSTPAEPLCVQGSARPAGLAALAAAEAIARSDHAAFHACRPTTLGELIAQRDVLAMVVSDFIVEGGQPLVDEVRAALIAGPDV